MSEIHAILPVLLASFGRLYQLNPSLKAILPLAKTEHHAAVDAIIKLHAPHLTSALQTLTPKDWQASTDFDANYTASQYAMQISTLTILASGTATLEALMLQSPMIVVYKINALTYFIAKRLVKTPYVALPNILAAQSGPAIVPELIQKQATPHDIVTTALGILNQPERQQQQLRHVLTQLQQNQSDAAHAILTHFQSSTKRYS
ncbi:Lipid-A-disaccharide synthase [Moraxella ovis]|uniref:Lipid-A-disaccharide synthase n=1 Tax=Moraxella ovis TaxID=29433 RepID=A0A378PKS7_9GAMM|nr:Lipid-A-disaccharide synthase [Moraxella ovis]